MYTNITDKSPKCFLVIGIPIIRFFKNGIYYWKPLLMLFLSLGGLMTYAYLMKQKTCVTKNIVFIAAFTGIPRLKQHIKKYYIYCFQMQGLWIYNPLKLCENLQMNYSTSDFLSIFCINDINTLIISISYQIGLVAVLKI